MNVERLRIKIEEAIYEWADETKFIEASSPPRANTEQPLVRPPGTLKENPPRSPDRETIKLVYSIFMEELRAVLISHGGDTAATRALVELQKSVYRRFTSVDQGDGHKRLSEVDEWADQKSTSFKSTN